MIDSLPLVEKAQPWKHTCGEFKHEQEVFMPSDVKRERSSWLAREKALKTKIQKVGLELEDTYNSFWMPANIPNLIKELSLLARE